MSSVIWHDLECGGYRSDLALWRSLGAAAQGPVLDIGAGTGRVALDLARAGHAVIAVEQDRHLVDELRRRSAGLPIECVLGDARELDLLERDLDLCVVAMQTIQLLGGPTGRGRFLRAVRRHVRGGALLACAITGRLHAFGEADATLPTPDRVRHGETLYVSQPTAVGLLGEHVALERRRETLARDGTHTSEENVIELDQLTRRELEQEAARAGWRAERARTISATRDHVGSTVVMLRA